MTLASVAPKFCTGKKLIIVPNKEIAGSRLVNYLQPRFFSKIQLKNSVGMNEDLAEEKRIISGACNVISYYKDQSVMILHQPRTLLD